MSKIQIQVESPIKNYDFADIDGNILGSVSFIPTDLDVFDRLGEIKNLINEAIPDEDGLENMNPSEILAQKNLINEKVKDIFDYVLATDTSALFNIIKPLIVFEDGKMWFALVLFNIISIVEKETGKSTEKLRESLENKNIDKYINKYKVPGKRPGRK